MDSKIFRQAWGNFATGVALVTTIEQDGTVHGMTANGVASISLDPMLVMVCVGHKAKTYRTRAGTRTRSVADAARKHPGQDLL